MEKDKDPCWKKYKMVGMKKKGDKMVPNCIPEETQLDEAPIKHPNQKVLDANMDGELSKDDFKILRKKKSVTEVEIRNLSNPGQLDGYKVNAGQKEKGPARGQQFMTTQQADEILKANRLKVNKSVADQRARELKAELEVSPKITAKQKAQGLISAIARGVGRTLSRGTDIIRGKVSDSYEYESDLNLEPIVEMTDRQKAKRDKLVKMMMKHLDKFKEKYGEKAEGVIYGIATKRAMKESVQNIEEMAPLHKGVIIAIGDSPNSSKTQLLKDIEGGDQKAALENMQTIAATKKGFEKPKQRYAKITHVKDGKSGKYTPVNGQSKKINTDEGFLRSQFQKLTGRTVQQITPAQGPNSEDDAKVETPKQTDVGQVGTQKSSLFSKLKKAADERRKAAKAKDQVGMFGNDETPK